MVSRLINIQITPYFRDEDAQQNRNRKILPVVSFVEQDDVFEVVEELMVKLFKNFSKKNFR